MTRDEIIQALRDGKRIHEWGPGPWYSFMRDGKFLGDITTAQFQWLSNHGFLRYAKFGCRKVYEWKGKDADAGPTVSS